MAKKPLPKHAGVVVAHARNDITIPYFSTVLAPVDDTLITRGNGKGLKLYDEIERDTHAWSVLQKRKKTLVAREWVVAPGGDAPVDQEAADFIEEQLKSMPFDKICEDLLDATLKGFAISEIIWKRDGNRIVVDKVITHDQRRFVFDEKWKPRLLTWSNMLEGEQLPEKKFMIHRHGVKGNNPYGLGLGTRLFWPVLFKREGVAFWMHFLEKFAGPTVVGKAPVGMLDEEQQKFLNSLEAGAQRKSIVIPIDADIDMLEAKRSGAVSYEDWCKYWDGQMSVATLGEMLTTNIGDVGSLAAAQTHAEILELLVDADGDLLADTLAATIFHWQTGFNFPAAKTPKVYRIRAKNEKEEAETRKAKAEAAMAENKAIREIIATAAKIDDDKKAETFITSFDVIRSLDEDVIKTLVEMRAQFGIKETIDDADKPEDDPLKKKDSGNVAFAEDARGDLAEELHDHAMPIIKARLDAIRTELDAASSLQDAARRLLELRASWSPTAMAKLFAPAFELAALQGRDAVLREMDGEDDQEAWLALASRGIGRIKAAFADPQSTSQPFLEQIEYFKQKERKPTRRWQDAMHGDHDRVFVVAGAIDDDLISDFQTSIGRAITDGTTLRDFRKDFDAIVSKHGWSYKGERGWRSRVIFETNIRTSYMAGRLAQMRDPAVIKRRPFWEYLHGVTRKPKVPRPTHKSWHGLILRHDDPFWRDHFPPNDWLCSCDVRTLSKRDLERRGLTGPDEPPPVTKVPHKDKATGDTIMLPEGVGYGWNYQPGDLWQRGLVPSRIEKAIGKQVVDIDPVSELITSGKPFKAKRLPEGKSDEWYLGKFLKAFGAKDGKPAIFKDKAGGHLVISDQLFRNAAGELKISKYGRKLDVMFMAETIKDPDEIWMGIIERGIHGHEGRTERLIDRRYIRTDPKTGIVAIFELVKDVWSGKTIFAPLAKRGKKMAPNQIDKRRGGKLIYQRSK